MINFNLRKNDKKVTKTLLSNYLILPLLIPFKDNLVTKQQQPQPQQQWVLANYFPIIIRNPLQEIASAISGVVQYGPNASLTPINCRLPRDVGEQQLNNLNLNEMAIKMSEMLSNLKTRKIDNDDYDDNDIENIRLILKDKKPVTLSGNENKRYWNRENTGNGIFIHRIKVRHGGVAIAGPNGIATAGNGGTAIVGPNGWALTQPNSVAIAGPGSRVIGVDPTTDLKPLAEEILKLNGSLPRNLEDRIIAKGPIIYYNTGKSSS